MKFKKKKCDKKHFEINKFDGEGIELVLPQSRTPALEKKQKYYMGIELDMRPYVPRGTKKLGNIELVLTQLWPGILKFSPVILTKLLLRPAGRGLRLCGGGGGGPPFELGKPFRG